VISTPAQLIVARIRTAHRAQPYLDTRHYHPEPADDGPLHIDTARTVAGQYVHPSLVGVSDEDF